MEMRKFKDIREFAEDRILNKVIYESMCYNKKRDLKKYIYSLQEKNDKKDLIWEYLNEPVDSEYYLYVNTMICSYIRWNNGKSKNRL